MNSYLELVLFNYKMSSTCHETIDSTNYVYMSFGQKVLQKQPILIFVLIIAILSIILVN